MTGGSGAKEKPLLNRARYDYHSGMNTLQNEYCQVTVSATSEEEANALSDSLVRRKLVAGSLILHGRSRYWWEGKIVEMIYYNVQTFSLFANKEEIISEVKKLHRDKCPIVAFVPLDGNMEFLQWIRDNVNVKR